MEGLSLGELHITLEGHAGDVTCTAWSPSSQDAFCSCCGDKKIRVWKIEPSIESPDTPVAPVKTVPAHKFYINSCAYNPSGDLFATTSSDDTIKIWSTASWACLKVLSLHEGSVRGCCFSPDGNLFASVSDDTTVRVWEVGALKCITTISKHSESVICCQFAPNGWLLATGASNGQLLLFDAFSGDCVAKKRIGTAHDGTINAIAMQPPGGGVVSPAEATPTLDSVAAGGIGGGRVRYFLASAGNDCMVKIWRVECGMSYDTSKGSVSLAMETELGQHTAPVYSCVYHPSLPFLATGSRDKTVILWNTLTFEKVQRLQAHSRYVTHISFAPSGQYLATASNDRSVKIWRLSNSTSQTEESSSAPGTSQSTQNVTDPKTPSLISAAGWSVDSVCKWAESVARQQNTPGASVHPDDIRAADQLVGALGQLSLDSSISGSKSGGGDFLCPITCQVMHDPVVASDGYSYERTAITEWFSKGRRTSPVTNLPLTSTLLLPNRALKVALTNSASNSSAL